MMRDNRYDGILHLVTAADGAEDFYENQTNEARYENIEQAKQQDERLRKAYFGHAKWFMIDNKHSKNFDDKINRCLEACYNILEMPSCVRFYKKFLLKKNKLVNQDERFNIPIDI